MNFPKEIKTQHILFGRVFPAIGVTGLVITIALNLVALLIFKKTSAEFFSSAWWRAWFSSYIVWVAFLVIGLAGVMTKKEPN